MMTCSTEGQQRKNRDTVAFMSEMTAKPTLDYDSATTSPLLTTLPLRLISTITTGPRLRTDGGPKQFDIIVLHS